MAKRGASRNVDPLEVVVLVDQHICDEQPDLASQIIVGLQRQFEVERTVKSTYKRLRIPHSVQWITKKTDENYAKIPNEWKVENFSLLLVPSSKFEKLVKDSFDFDHGLHNLLQALTSNVPINENTTLKVVVFDDQQPGHAKRKKNGSHFNFELKRLEEQKLFEWVTECQIMKGVDVSFKPKSFEDIVLAVVQATKSILDCTKPDEIFKDGDDVWIPKKSGPGVAVAANGVGLMLLWNRYLMQISKVIGCEQAKNISANPKFCSPAQAIDAYKECSNEKEGEELLSSCCVVRPPASTKDVLALRGSRPKIGIETSKKVFKALTSTNGQEKL